MAYIGQATVTSKGRITLPSAMRAKFGIVSGDCIEFLECHDGTIKLWIRNRPAAALVGLLAGLKPDPRYRTDDEAIAAEVDARDRRSRSNSGRSKSEL